MQTTATTFVDPRGTGPITSDESARLLAPLVMSGVLAARVVTLLPGPGS